MENTSMADMIKIGDQFIGSGYRPFVIAEMSGNHNQSLDRALEIIEAAAKAGVHAIKLQTYTADTMTLDIHEGEFYIADENSLWSGSSLYELYQKAYTPWEWHKTLFDHARKLGLIAFSSPFDETAVDFLERLDVPAYKIASFEMTDLPLIRKVAATGKPMIISTGMASLQEIDMALKTARKSGAKDIILLKCTSTYPASPENTNLCTIPHMRSAFGTQVGLSDHTMGIGAAVASVALGATVIEKHFTLRRKDGGVDSTFSMEPEEMSSLVIEAERAWHAMGTIRYGASGEEKNSLVYRRSIYISQDIKAGDMLSEKNLRIVRPGLGLEPKYFEILLGKRVNRDVKIGTPASWDLIG